MIYFCHLETLNINEIVQYKNISIVFSISSVTVTGSISPNRISDLIWILFIHLWYLNIYIYIYCCCLGNSRVGPTKWFSSKQRRRNLSSVVDVANINQVFFYAKVIRWVYKWNGCKVCVRGLMHYKNDLPYRGHMNVLFILRR